MGRRKDFQAATTYTGQRINKSCDISYKIDGVRVLYRDGEFVTRNDKIPPGLNGALTQGAKDKIELYKDCEVFKGSFFESNSPLSRHDPETDCITQEHIYPLDFVAYETSHYVDPRLYIETVTDPSRDLIRGHLQKALDLGYEGLVLRIEGRWYRVKPEYTADVYITDWFEQLNTAKEPKGQLGGFDTKYGKVTAFTEEMRQQLWDNPQQYVGKMMTVQYKELYDTGSFRYCVKFLHFRDDKDEEAFDTKAGEIVSW